MTGATTGVPLLLATLVTFPLVVYHRDAFDQSLELSPFQLTALAMFAGVQVYGTIGAYVLKADYVGIETWTDAFYYIVVTGTTVGYGDATPTSQTTKLFTLSIIVTSTAAFGAVFGSLLVPALESRITSAFGNMTASELTLLEDHVLVLGYGDLTEPLLDQLAVDADVVVVTPDAEMASSLRSRDISVLTADPTDEAALRDARIEAARGVVAASDDDAQNALAVLAVRQTNADVRVVAAANDPRHVDKLRGVGADDVVSPAVLGGRLLGQSVLGEQTPSFDETDEESDAT
jgi:voltage-gated potassium channel